MVSLYILIWFRNVLAYFVLHKISQEKILLSNRNILKTTMFQEIIESTFWKMSKGRNMIENKTNSL